ncbi:potassium channel family protein [Desulforhopalus singaporensis]|nr:NAD-binding protein [Desulforhopalus singaporensis]
MKFLFSQLAFFSQTSGARRNQRLLLRFLLFLTGMISIYSVLFHVLMLYEGREYSWVTGFYWALTVMSTLGFGDITFHSDLGLVFTIIVLVTGIIFMLIVLPFTFIQFFWVPWLEEHAKNRAPKQLSPEIRDHVIITNLDPITMKLVEKLERRNYEYVIVTGDQQYGAELWDSGYKVVIGEPDDPETFRRLRVERAAMVVATNDDLINTNISFTVREISEHVPIVSTADNEHSLDILKFPGNTQVFQFMKMLGESLAERTQGFGSATTRVSNFDKLLIGEISAKRTSLAGKIIAETDLRQKSGAIIIGLWEKGNFEVPQPETMIHPSTLLLLAGTEEQLVMFEKYYTLPGTEYSGDDPVLILGGGRVGVAAAGRLKEYGIPYRIVEKKGSLAGAGNDFIHGDAADLNVLKQAGIEQARAVIITTHNDAMNIYLSFYCRQLRPEVQLICRATNERNVAKLHMAGADLVLSYASMGANAVINVLKTDEISMFTEGLNIFSLPMPAVLAGKTLVESRIRPLTGCSVVAIRNAQGLLVGPDPMIPLNGDDDLILIGTTEAEKKFTDLF